MSSAGGSRRYRCKYFNTRNCSNWAQVSNSACADCVSIQHQRDPSSDMIPIHHTESAISGYQAPPQRSTIAVLFSKCSSQFRKFYVGLTCKDRQAHQVSLSRLADEYGRFGVWGGNSGADRTGPGSLDERLRNDPSLNSIVLDLLQNLYDDLERVTLMAMGGEDSADVTSGKPHSVRQDRDSSSTQSSDTENPSDDHKNPRPRTNEMGRLVSVIYGQIQSLYKVSLLLRRPDIHDMYIPSAPGNQSVYRIAYRDMYEISRKIREWALNRGHRYEEPVGAQYLVPRLAIANSKRREQLRFWQKHPNRPASIGDQPAVSAKGQPAASGSLRGGFSQSQPRQIESEPSTASPPEGTKQGFSVATKSVLDGDGAPSGGSSTAYGPSSHDKGRPSGLPDVPRPQTGRVTFDCPLCLSELEVGEMQQRQTWKEHVFRDLRPYVCTFEQCVNAEKLYATRHDWLYHEMQIHRRRWVCASGCNSSFKTKMDLEQHMREGHEGAFAELQLPILLDICERSTELEEVTNCPFCPEASKLCDLHDHLAAHLEELALLVLPIDVDDLIRGASSGGADISLPSRIKTGWGLGGSGTISDVGSGGAFTSLGAREPGQPLKGKEVYGRAELAVKPLHEGTEISSQGERFDTDDVPQAPPQSFAGQGHYSDDEQFRPRLRRVTDSSSSLTPSLVRTDATSATEENRPIRRKLRDEWDLRVILKHTRPNGAARIGAELKCSSVILCYSSRKLKTMIEMEGRTIKIGNGPQRSLDIIIPPSYTVEAAVVLICSMHNLSHYRWVDSFEDLMHLAIACWELECPTGPIERIGYTSRIDLWRPPAEAGDVGNNTQNYVEWVFVALVFGWEDIFRAASKEVMMGRKLAMGDYLPDDLRRAIKKNQAATIAGIISFVRQTSQSYLLSDSIFPGVIYTFIKTLGECLQYFNVRLIVSETAEDDVGDVQSARELIIHLQKLPGTLPEYHGEVPDPPLPPSSPLTPAPPSTSRRSHRKRRGVFQWISAVRRPSKIDVTKGSPATQQENAGAQDWGRVRAEFMFRLEREIKEFGGMDLEEFRELRDRNSSGQREIGGDVNYTVGES